MPAQTLIELAAAAPAGAGLRVRIEGTTLEGKDVQQDRAAAARRRRAAARSGSPRAGLRVMALPAGVQVMSVALNSAGRQGRLRAGLHGHRASRPSGPRPAKEWLFVPALLVLGAVLALQRRRAGAAAPT